MAPERAGSATVTVMVAREPISTTVESMAAVTRTGAASAAKAAAASDRAATVERSDMRVMSVYDF